MFLRTRHGQAGFTLIELIMVVALLLIIIALAIPSLLRSRIAANESSAASTLRVLFNAEFTYTINYSSYSSDLNSLGPPPAGTPPSQTSADLVDTVLAGRVSGTATQFTKSGYLFVYIPTGTYPSIQLYAVAANPVARGSTGQRSFWIDQTGVIRSNATAAASSSDLPLL